MVFVRLVVRITLICGPFILAAPIAALQLSLSPDTDACFSEPPASDAIGEVIYAVHDAGAQWLGLRNDGIFANPYQDTVSVPELEYPGGSGTLFLYGGGLWIGGTKGGVPIVACGYERYTAMNEFGQLEFCAEEDRLAFEGVHIGWLEKTSNHTAQGDQISARTEGRYLGIGIVNVDDDLDGAIDEDPAGDIAHDYLDNDGDGMIDASDPDYDGDLMPGSRDDDGDGLEDEDDYASATLELITAYVDTCQACVDQQCFSEEFASLGIRVVQHTKQWDMPYADDLIIVGNELTNISGTVLEDIWIGAMFDFDVGHTTQEPGRRSEDDITYFLDELQVAVGADNDGDDGLLEARLFGVRFIGLPVSDADLTYLNLSSIHGYVSCDNEPQHRSMTSGTVSPDRTTPSDWAFLIAVGPLGDIEPGQSLTATYAVVNGADEKELRYAARLSELMIDQEFTGPEAPEAPQFRALPADMQVTIVWMNNAEYSVEPVLDEQDFQGYNVWRTPDGESWTLLATYDLQDTIGMNAGWPPKPSDNEDYAYELIDEDVMNGSRFSYVVTAFDDGNNGDGINTPAWDDRYGGIGVLESSRGEDVLQTAIPAEPAQAEGEIDNVFVVPNPYVGSSRLEQHGWSSGDGRIEFRGLPPECEIEIWTLAGDFVRRFRHDNGLSWESWDVRNDEGDEVSGGIYVYRVSSGGNERIGKFLVVR